MSEREPIKEDPIEGEPIKEESIKEEPIKGEPIINYIVSQLSRISCVKERTKLRCTTQVAGSPSDKPQDDPQIFYGGPEHT